MNALAALLLLAPDSESVYKQTVRPFLVTH
jgi:hypothetical protein